jgi:LuxR family transcriptional regulator, maltose regulon positive regulatory protein
MPLPLRLRLRLLMPQRQSAASLWQSPKAGTQGTQSGSIPFGACMIASERAAARRTGKAAPGKPAQLPLDGWQRLRHGLDLALADIERGRDDLRAALASFGAQGCTEGRLIAAAALVQFIGIADDDYTGFEEAVAAVAATLPAIERIVDADQRLLARTGALVAGWFQALDDPGLAAQADAITRELGNEGITPAVRCCAGLATLAYFDAQCSLEGVLWVELAMRPVLAAPGVGTRLAEEWQHALVQALYQCGAPARAEALQAQRGVSLPMSVPAIELKRLLVQAQMAIGEGRVDTGRNALTQAETLLHPRVPRQASWWHLLKSRLDLVDGRHHEALTHARLALRLAEAGHFPERWMGLTVMQEGQVQMAGGGHAAAVPFFERAGRAATGAQAGFCWCLAHFARALARFESGAEDDLGRADLSQGLALAQQLHWLNFFRASPRVAAQVCALGLEHRIETAFVREVIATRGLDAVRPDLSAWPWPIRVLTLGRFQIEQGGAALSFGGKVARKPLELLQFVIASGGCDVSAATVMFALWREFEGDKAKSAFNVALHRLRKLLDDDDAVQLELGRVSLNPKRVWVDCLAFEQLVDATAGTAQHGLTTQAVSSLRRAVAMYGGHFLHETEDEPWQMVCRTRLASKFKRSVMLLARDDVSNRDSHAVRALLERALELDPMAEDLARELMQLLSASGEQAAALSVFEHCKAAIARGLGAKPAAATLALVERVRAMA